MANAPVVFRIDWPACIRCGACVAVCPQPAGFTTPFDTIAEGVPCDIACMACEPICPTTAITHAPASGTEAPARHAAAGPSLGARRADGAP